MIKIPVALGIVTVVVPKLVMVNVKSLLDARTEHEHPVMFAIHFELAILNPTYAKVNLI